MDRRTFLRNTSYATMAYPLLLQSCKVDPGMPIIDTHQHLWNLELFPLAWVPPVLDRNFLMEDYLQAIEGQNVVKAIYMEVDVPPELRKKEAEWALQLCKDPDNLTEGAVIRADPGNGEFETYMRSFEGNPYLKGVRYFFSNAEEMLSAQVVENLCLLGEMDLSFDLLLPPELLQAGTMLLDRCPGTRFILNHCGRADPVAFFPDHQKAPRAPRHDRDKWYRDMVLLAERANIICKISGIVSNVPNFPLSATDLAPIINHCMDVFGPDRVIFAGDWPVCLMNMTLAQWIGTLKEIISGLSHKDRKKLFYDNAFSFYQLDDK